MDDVVCYAMIWRMVAREREREMEKEIERKACFYAPRPAETALKIRREKGGSEERCWGDGGEDGRMKWLLGKVKGKVKVL